MDEDKTLFIQAPEDKYPDINELLVKKGIRVSEMKTTEDTLEDFFLGVIDEEEATLGGDLLSRDEFELSPGQGREINSRTHDEARYFGVLVAYRDIDQAHWRASTPLEKNSKNKIIVTVGKQTVKIHHR